MDIGIVQYANRSPDIFDVHFNGDCIETLVTHEASKVVDWINGIESSHLGHLHRLIVGLDVEWRPNTYRHQRNPVATLQLCFGNQCLIFQLLYCSYIPDKLFTFLLDSSYTFVGVGIHGDLEKLSYHYRLDATNAVDLCDLAADDSYDPSLRNVSLKHLARIYLGAEMEKPLWVTLSSWDQAWLTDEQIKYACVDAFVSFKLGRVLNASVHS